MPRTLCSAAIVTFVLCGPALAQPAPAPSAPPAQLRLSLVISPGTAPNAQVRKHELALVEGGCGTVNDLGPQHHDEIQVCSKPTEKGLLLDTDWRTRSGTTSYQMRWQSLVSRNGGTVDVGSRDGLRFTMTVR
ncbi:MAG: hypothetical protein ACTHU0_27665 [Kofleriaceae bacterium]